jgi:hypothetical protein
MKSNSFIVFSLLLITLFYFVSFVNGRQNDGYDLDSDAPIRIGVKRKVSSKNCQLSIITVVYVIV